MLFIIFLVLNVKLLVNFLIQIQLILSFIVIFILRFINRSCYIIMAVFFVLSKKDWFV